MIALYCFVGWAISISFIATYFKGVRDGKNQVVFKKMQSKLG